MYNPFSLENKTILITGASSGIGRATAIECSRLGARCIITARNEKRLSETFTQLSGNGHISIIADMQNNESFQKLIDSVPVLDGLVNNAGITITTPVKFITQVKYSELLRVNQESPILLFSSLLKKKKFNKNSSIVFTSSVAGAILGGEKCNSMYASTKGAISGFVKVAALELAEKQIRVNAVCPGMTETSILNESVIDSVDIEANKKRYPLGRFAKPEEIAYGIIYLLSNASSFTTGTNLIIDGGFSVE